MLHEGEREGDGERDRVAALNDEQKVGAQEGIERDGIDFTECECKRNRVRSFRGSLPGDSLGIPGVYPRRESDFPDASRGERAEGDPGPNRGRLPLATPRRETPTRRGKQTWGNKLGDRARVIDAPAIFSLSPLQLV